MKIKLLSVILTVLMIAMLAIPSVITTSAESTAILLGDADGDDDISISDATVIQRYLARYVTLTDDQLTAADADSDGTVDISDATMIQRWLAKLDTDNAIGKVIGSTDSTDETDESEVTGDEWKENTGVITLSDDGITVTGSGITVVDNVVFITEGGDWEVVGECSDGMIYVNTGEEKDINDKVKLRLSGMTLTNTSGPAIYFDRCKKAFITIESDTENTVSDGTSYASAVEYTVDGETYSVDCSEAKAAIHSDDSLEIKGKGTLTVTGSYKHGICSDDDILIENGVIGVTSVKDAFHANDDITIDGKNVEITINSSSDGFDSEGTLNLTLLKSADIRAAGKGIKADGDITITDGTYTVDTDDDCVNGNAAVTILGGTLTLCSDDEGITAVTDLTIENATVTVDCEGKGIKTDENLVINSGTFDIDSTDDCVHSNANITINGGTFTLTSGDDGVHADTALTIEDGIIDVTKSYEGIEGNDVIINGGTVSVVASDDGINAAGGNDQSSMNGRQGQNQFRPGSASNNAITVNDGYIYVIADGDGIDSNGALNFGGGTVIVQGPASGGNSPIDADGTVGFGGGTVIALASSSAMWEDLNGKIGNAVYTTSAGSVSKGKTVCVTDSEGNVLSALTSQLSGNIGIVYYTDRTSSLGSVRFVTGGTYSGSLDSFGYGEGGTVSGGSSTSPSSGSQPGRQPGGGF